ncbi:hypothetical protein [Saccharospirillum mangrovi]|uniref:hypothetical protein n=1 Tax=Saccharospirillum mangrovi TaxID=2161747 RepID=UPI000D39089B|nr:hypothetical protein [Saccharospirillum mangrovi]
MNWMIIPDAPLWSALVILLLALVLLYAARLPVHRLVQRLSRLVTSLLRLYGRSLAALADQVRLRNREVLLELGRSREERRLERHFHQVKRLVERDLARFPDLQQAISRHIAQLEDDYYRTAETPPPAPDWLDAIDKVVHLREIQSGNPVVSKVLADLESKLHRQHEQSLEDFRRGMQQRHRLLHSMMPHWRKLNHEVEDVGRGMRGLLNQAAHIDQHYRQYRALRSHSDRIEKLQRVSVFGQFMLASLLLSAWALVGWLNVRLIRPAFESTAIAEPILGSITWADLSAWALVLVIAMLGTLLLEALQITRIFTSFSFLDDRRRRWVFWSVVTALVVLALSQAGLVFLHERMQTVPELYHRLIAYPVVVYEAPLIDQGVPLLARMLLGPVLTFLLMFAIVPLERWVENGRILLGDVLVAGLRFMSLVVRLLASLIRNSLALLLAAYDVLISLPLWLENLWLQVRKQRHLNKDMSPESTQVGVNSR